MTDCFEDVLLAHIVEGVNALGKETGVCTLSLFAWDEENDERRPALNLGYNTRAHLAISVLEARPFRPDRKEPLRLFGGPATDVDEARWNPSIWKNQWFREIRSDGDVELPEFAVARERWLRESGLWISDADYDRILDEYAAGRRYGSEAIERLIDEYLSLLERVVHRLHDEGYICRAFGDAIPVLVMDVDTSLRFIELTKRANPAGLVDEYCIWARTP